MLCFVLLSHGGLSGDFYKPVRGGLKKVPRVEEIWFKERGETRGKRAASSTLLGLQ